FLPDESLLVGSFDGALERWRTIDAHRLATATAAPSGPVASIAVTPGGRAILTSSLTTGTVRQWSVGELALLAEYPGDAFALTAIAVFDNGAGITWPIRLGAWERRACALAGRELTQSEWRQLLPRRGYAAVCGGSAARPSR